MIVAGTPRGQAQQEAVDGGPGEDQAVEVRQRPLDAPAGVQARSLDLTPHMTGQVVREDLMRGAAADLYYHILY